jgi:parvulin-like peptidyl-prolyl isomerase
MRWIATFLVLLLLVGTVAGDGNDRMGIAATVNDSVITWGDVYKRVGETTLQMVRNNPDPTQARVMEEQLVRDALRELVRELLFLHEAGRLGLIITEQQVLDEELMEIERAGGRDSYLKLLEARGISKEDALNSLRTRLVVQGVLYALRTGRSGSLPQDRTVSPEDIERFYKENMQMFSIKESFTLAAIQIRIKKVGLQKDAETLMEAIQRRLDLGAGFEETASQFSHIGARQGGRFDEVSRADLPTAIVDSFLAMKDGDVSDVIDDGDDKLWLVKRIRYQEALTRPLDDVQEEILRELSSVKRLMADEKVIKELMKRSHVDPIEILFPKRR